MIFVPMIFCERPGSLTRAFDEELSRGADGPVLQSSDRNRPRMNRQVDWQSLESKALGAEMQQGSWTYCEIPFRDQCGIQLNPRRHHVSARNTQSVRSKGFRNQ